MDTPAEIVSPTALCDATGETDGVMERHTLRCFRPLKFARVFSR